MMEPSGKVPLMISRILPPLAIMVATVAFAPLGYGQPQSPDPHHTAHSVTQHYRWLVFQHYKTLSRAAHELQDTITGFVQLPIPATHKAAQAAWIKTRLIYGPTEAYRFYDGPIDNPQTGVEGLLNAWPLDEMYIDGTGFGTAGIIGATEAYPVITPALLRALNAAGSEKNIASGFHAIEFLLWGPDRNAKAAGSRSYKDFLYDRQSFGMRRSAYLMAATQLLVAHCEYLEEAWDPARPGSYGAAWRLLPETTKLSHMMTGMATLLYSELAGERLFAPLDEQDQEHEQSCFSDTTHLDTLGNLLGAANIYHGTLTAASYRAPHAADFHITVDLPDVKGPSLRDYLTLHAPEKVPSIDQAFARATAAAAGIPVPFDQAITTAKAQVLASVLAIRTLGVAIQAAGTDLGIPVTIGNGEDHHQNH